MRKEERERQLKFRKMVAAGVFLGVGTIASLVGGLVHIGGKIDDKHFTLSEVEEEILIHSGYKETLDGDHIYPESPHGCEVPDDGRDFDERLSEKMFEEGYDRKVIEKAIEKFELLYEGEYQEAKEIDLKAIDKEVKDSKAMARFR